MGPTRLSCVPLSAFWQTAIFRFVPDYDSVSKILDRSAAAPHQRNVRLDRLRKRDEDGSNNDLDDIFEADNEDEDVFGFDDGEYQPIRRARESYVRARRAMT